LEEAQNQFNFFQNEIYLKVQDSNESTTMNFHNNSDIYFISSIDFEYVIQKNSKLTSKLFELNKSYNFYLKSYEDQKNKNNLLKSDLFLFSYKLIL
jgi:hypothetical protein